MDDCSAGWWEVQWVALTGVSWAVDSVSRRAASWDAAKAGLTVDPKGLRLGSHSADSSESLWAGHLAAQMAERKAGRTENLMAAYWVY